MLCGMPRRTLRVPFSLLHHLWIRISAVPTLRVQDPPGGTERVDVVPFVVFKRGKYKVLTPFYVMLKEERSRECAEVEVGILGGQGLLQSFVGQANVFKHLCLLDLGYLDHQWSFVRENHRKLTINIFRVARQKLVVRLLGYWMLSSSYTLARLYNMDVDMAIPSSALRVAAFVNASSYIVRASSKLPSAPRLFSSRGSDSRGITESFGCPFHVVSLLQMRYLDVYLHVIVPDTIWPFGSVSCGWRIMSNSYII